MSDVVNELIKEDKFKNCAVQFVQIEAEDFEKISLDYSVEAVPTFVFIKVLTKKNNSQPKIPNQNFINHRYTYIAISFLEQICTAKTERC